MSDLISREAVLREFTCLSDDAFVINSTIQKIVMKLPSVEPETCGDCISREAAIYAVGYYSVHSDDKLLFADKPLKDLPSVESERKPGKWIEGKKTPGYTKWNCSECGLLVRNTQKPWYEYCPKCGAPMEVNG